MPRPVCTLCGAENSSARIYVAMGKVSLNFVGLACVHCGKTGTQMFRLGEYLAFGMIYGLIAGLLVVLGIHLFDEESVAIEIVAGIAAVLPWTFLPIWWAGRMAEANRADAPREDLTNWRKFGLGAVTVAVIALVVGVMVFSYMMLVD